MPGMDNEHVGAGRDGLVDAHVCVLANAGPVEAALGAPHLHDPHGHIGALA